MAASTVKLQPVTAFSMQTGACAGILRNQHEILICVQLCVKSQENSGLITVQ